MKNALRILLAGCFAVIIGLGLQFFAVEVQLFAHVGKLVGVWPFLRVAPFLIAGAVTMMVGLSLMVLGTALLHLL